MFVIFAGNDGCMVAVDIVVTDESVYRHVVSGLNTHSIPLTFIIMTPRML
jgi:hypothetical protein